MANFDRRAEPLSSSISANAKVGVVNLARDNAAANLRYLIADVRIDSDPIFGGPKFISSAREFLTGPNGSGPTISAATEKLFSNNELHRGVKTFLTEHRALFGFGPEALATAKVNRDYVNGSSGFDTVVWQQQLENVAVFESVFQAHHTKNGELINVSSQFVPDLKTAVLNISNRTTLLASPPVSAHQALVFAAQNIGEVFTTNQIDDLDTASGAEKTQHFRGFPVLNNSSACLTWLPVDASTLRLCWNVEVAIRGAHQTGSQNDRSPRAQRNVSANA